jgi:signal transduction histidine kinase
VQLGFALLDYSAPDRVRYAYRLKGLEQAWTSATAESRIARYTNVPPGDYTFEVRAQSRVGDWTTAQWPMRVEPTWYETRHARGAAAAAVLLLLWAMVRLRLRLHEGRASQLREQVAQRTRELQQRTEQLEASRQALRKLGAHNAGLLEEERKRVARELHDELGQQLAALRMEVSVMKARSDAGKPPDTGQWQLIRDRVDRLTGSMRALVADLRPPALDGGLSAALEWLAAEHARASGTPCSVEVDPQERALAQEVKTMIFRVAQESLHNILRHAGATQARVELKRDEAGWDLRVSDDGAGFDATKPPRGFGLLSMEERAQLVGGTLRIYSRPGKGTCVHLHLPDDLPPTGQGTA